MTIAACCLLPALMFLIAGRETGRFKNWRGRMQLAGHSYSVYKFPARSLQVRPGSRQEVVAISIKREKKKKFKYWKSFCAGRCTRGLARLGSQTFVSFLPHEEQVASDKRFLQTAAEEAALKHSLPQVSPDVIRQIMKRISVSWL